jgi:hypothetical protein
MPDGYDVTDQKEWPYMQRVHVLRHIMRTAENQYNALMDVLSFELADAIEDCQLFGGLSLTEVGQAMNPPVTRQRVHQLVKRGMPSHA